MGLSARDIGARAAESVYEQVRDEAEHEGGDHDPDDDQHAGGLAGVVPARPGTVGRQSSDSMKRCEHVARLPVPTAANTSSFARSATGKAGVMPKKILALVSEPVSGEALRNAVGSDAHGAEVLVVAPALNSRTQFWMSDVDEAIGRAEEVQQETVERMEEEGLDAAGDTGESDPLLAIEDALQLFPADEIVLFTHEAGELNWAEEGVVDDVRERFDVPVEHLVISSS
jgi:hypothetical protein